MSLDAASLVIGLIAAGLLLFLIGIVPAMRRPVERYRLQRPSKRSSDATGEQWVYQSPAPDEKPTEPFSPIADAGVDEPKRGEQGSQATIADAEPGVAESQVATQPRQQALRLGNEAEAARIVDDALRQARELLQEAEAEAKRVVIAAGQERARRENEMEQERADLERQMRLDAVSTVQEAARAAEELLVAAEDQCASIVREAESEADRKAAEVTEDAGRRARALLEAAELEAKQIVADTGHERARLLGELEQERSILEETRKKLDSLTVIEEAVQKAEEQLVAARERQEDVRRENEAQAASIVAAAGQERARLVKELAQERAILEEARTKLSGFLADVLEEVEAGPTASQGSANVRDLGEALAARTSAGADR